MYRSMETTFVSVLRPALFKRHVLRRIQAFAALQAKAFAGIWM